MRKLNTLRGLAALIVFVTHFSDITHWLDGSFGVQQDALTRTSA